MMIYIIVLILFNSSVISVAPQDSLSMFWKLSLFVSLHNATFLLVLRKFLSYLKTYFKRKKNPKQSTFNNSESPLANFTNIFRWKSSFPTT